MGPVAYLLDFTELHAVDYQIPHYSGKSDAPKKRRFIGIGSQAVGGIFKKSDMSNTGRWIGV